MRKAELDLPLAAAVLGLALTLAIPAGRPWAAETTPEDLGTVRNDTLLVSLDKVRAAALAHNEMLAAGEAMADAARGDALGAWRGFLPHVQAAEFFLRSDDALSSFGYKLQQRSVTQEDFYPPTLNAPGVAENNITRLQLLQPVFNGGMALYGKRAADAMARAADHDYRRAAQTVEFQAIQAYEGLVLAKAYERVMLDAIAAAEGHARQAQSMLDAEMATEADLLQARVYLAGVKQKLIETRNLVAIAGENIKLLTATRTDLPLAPADGFADPAPLPPVVEAGGDLVARRPDVLARRQRADAAARMVGVARGALLPHVNLSLQRDWYGQSLFANDATSWTLGVYATWDIFAGLEDWGRVKTSRAQKRAAEHMYEFDLRRARVEATQARLETGAAAEKVQVAREAVTAAREGLRIVTSQHREGLASMVDLLDVQAAATGAEGNLVQALHDYNVGLARLSYTGAAPRAGEE
ncbi:MAG: TolC family protein [Candidatus Krumholzibacteriia bacterium]